MFVSCEIFSLIKNLFYSILSYCRLEKKHDDFDVERREYERQIKHLRLMVHEKDVLVSDASKDKK